MKQIQHFIVDQDISGDEIKIENLEIVSQMRKVLRMRSGDICTILDGKGKKADAEILEIGKSFVRLKLKNHIVCEKPEKMIRLFCALSKKPATFEMIVQKATELGAVEIVPLISERCQVRKLVKNERLKMIIKEAAEQCERCFLPDLKEAILFDDFIKEKPDGVILAGDAWNFDLKFSEIRSGNVVNLIIGPEGGLTDDELGKLREIGGKIFQLGDNVLRMETAAIAAIAVVQFS